MSDQNPNQTKLDINTDYGREGESVFHDHAPGQGDIFSCPACIANSER